MPASRTGARAFARRQGDFARWLVLASLLSGLAAQENPVPPAAAAAAEALVGSESAEVRGEAALLLACTHNPAWHPLLLRVAGDESEAARQRGLLALGILGAPGSSTALAAELEEGSHRARPTAVAAAFALTLCPPEEGTAALVEALTRCQKGSYRRQRDVLLALLLGAATRPAPALRQVLLQFHDDDALRDPELRAAVAAVLARVEGGLQAAQLRRLLTAGSPPERLVAVEALLPSAATDAESRPTMLRLQAEDPDPRVRAAALSWLAANRHLPALDLGAKAMRSLQPAEVAAGVRTVLQLGGGAMRRAVESHLLACAQPRLQGAMLAAFHGPASTEFGTACRGIAADRRRSAEERTAAALRAADAIGEAAAPVLRDLFAELVAVEPLVEVAAALLEVSPEEPDLDRLLPAIEDPALAAVRLHALLRAGHPQAAAAVLLRLRRTDQPPAAKAALLAALRAAWQPVPPAGPLPPPLDRLLQPLLPAR